MNVKRVPCLMLMAGGTGGHIFPGISIADCLKEQGWNVIWLGNPNGMEARLVPERGYVMEPLEFGALRGKGLWKKLSLPLKLVFALIRVNKVMQRVQPDVVLGMGGYISFPGGLMAFLRRVPFVIHEQNSVAGLSNRILAKLAVRTLTGFPDALPKGRWLGNPVRSGMTDLPPPAKRYDGRTGPLRLLVIGGSLGARVLNEMVPQGLALIPEHERPHVRHQSGTQHFQDLCANYQKVEVIARCEAFINDMAATYAWADLVICRAGASTISELTVAGVPAVLIPFPYAVDDHQTHNAHFLSNAGGAFFMSEAQLTPEAIEAIIRIERPQLKRMAEISHDLAKPNAANEVAAVCQEVMR